MNADDPQLSYVLLAYGRVAGILKEEIVPYLGAIMGHVLSSADLQPDVAILNGAHQSARRREVASIAWSVADQAGFDLVGRVYNTIRRRP